MQWRHSQARISLVKFKGTPRRLKTYVECVENHPWHVADEEDNDDQDEHFCDSLIPSLSVGGSIVSKTGVSDDPEGEAVENNEEDEGDEGHDDKVSNEKIVSAVSVVVSEGGRTNSGIQWGLAISVFRLWKLNMSTVETFLLKRLMS